MLLVVLVYAKVGCWGGSGRDVSGVRTVETTSGRSYCKTRDFSLPEQLVRIWRRIFNGFLNFEFIFPRMTVYRFSFAHRVALIIPNWENLQVSIGWEVPSMHNWCCFYGSWFFFSWVPWFFLLALGKRLALPTPFFCPGKDRDVGPQSQGCGLIYSILPSFLCLFLSINCVGTGAGAVCAPEAAKSNGSSQVKNKKGRVQKSKQESRRFSDGFDISKGLMDVSFVCSVTTQKYYRNSGKSHDLLPLADPERT